MSQKLRLKIDCFIIKESGPHDRWKSQTIGTPWSGISENFIKIIQTIEVVTEWMDLKSHHNNDINNYNYHSSSHNIQVTPPSVPIVKNPC